MSTALQALNVYIFTSTTNVILYRSTLKKVNTSVKSLTKALMINFKDTL